MNGIITNKGKPSRRSKSESAIGTKFGGCGPFIKLFGLSLGDDGKRKATEQKGKGITRAHSFVLFLRLFGQETAANRGRTREKAKKTENKV